MDIEFEKVTTRGGDTGESGLFSGERRRKDDLVFETLGDGDELVSAMGMARASLDAEAARPASAGSARGIGARGIGSRRPSSAAAKGVFAHQQVLFRVQAMIATSPGSELYAELRLVSEADVHDLEAQLEGLMKRTEIGPAFIVPGETVESAHIDVARTVCRRYERRIVSCIRDRHMNHLIPCQQFVNRLSDYLFVLARNVEQSG